jgi:thiol-disulfide isomerase/thioredoxin
LARHFETAQITSPVKDQRLRQRFLKRMSWTDWDQYQDLYAERNAIVSRLTIDTTLTDRERDSLRARANLLRAQRNSLGIIRVSRQIQVMAKEPVGQYWMHEMTVLAKALSYRYYLEFRPEIERLFDRLPPEVKDSPEGREIEDYLFPVKIVRIGDTLPDYEYIDRTGRACNLSEFLGKTVLLDFWSLSCGPCIKSMPILQELQEKAGDRLEIVSISLDKDRVWKRGHEEHPVSWTDWRDPSGYSGSIRSFKARGIPTFVLVSPQGVVQEIQEGFTEGSLQRLVGLEN